MDPDDPFKNSFLEDSFWIGHPISHYIFKTVLKSGRGKEKLFTSVIWLAFSWCRPAKAPVILKTI